MKAKLTPRLILGFGLATFFIWLIVEQINFTDLTAAFLGTNASWVVAGLISFAVGYLCRIERWRLMLSYSNKDIHFFSCAGPFLASYAVNNVFPLRAGDILRVFGFNSQLGAGASIVLATLFVERLLDFLMLLVVLGAALNLFDLDANSLIGIGSVILISLAIFIMLLLLFPKLFAPFVFLLGKQVERITPIFGKKVAEEFSKSLIVLEHLAKGTTMIKLVVWSVAVWFAEGCVFWFSAIALPSLAEPAAAWLALPVGTLATLIPSTPGYAGTFDYFTIHAMTTLGNHSAAAIAYTLLVHALLWLPPTIIGGAYLLLHPMKKRL
jgi:uncharacterized protein (TIRG00374 family)